MADYGAEYTDRKITELEKRITSIYREASDDIERKMSDFNDRYRVKEAKYAKQVADGKITQDDFDGWKRGQVFQGKQWQAKKQQIENTLYNANSVAVKMVNGETNGVFAANANFMSYSLESGAGVNFGFGLYDESTVANLIKNEPDLLPKPRIKKPKDTAWNSKKITRQITQGIIQGESLDDIATRLAKTTGSQNRDAMLTHARTAMTGAQNAGRQYQLGKAQDLGIKLKKEWMATLDAHTRDMHRTLDGQRVPVNEPFEVGRYSIMYPGDPSAAPAMVYNCRCTMVADLDDYPSIYDRYDNIEGKPIKNMTYREWEAAKSNAAEEVYTDFLGIRKSLGNEFVNAMETLLNFTEETDVKDLFYTYQHKLKVTDAHMTDDGAYFSPADGGIHINAEKIQQGDDLHAPYQTVFHEFGHNIDHAAVTDPRSSFTTAYKSGALEKKIKEDWHQFRIKYLTSHTDEWVSQDFEIRNLLRRVALRENKDNSEDTIWYDLVRQLRNGKITRDEVMSKYGEKLAKEYLQDKTTKYLVDNDIIKMLKNENMSLHARGSISDIIGGIMCSRGDNDWYAYPLGCGHQSTYWWKHKITKGYEITKVSSGKIPLEFFAEVIDGKAANPESLAQMRRVFPKSVKMVEQIIQEMIKNVT